MDTLKFEAKNIRLRELLYTNDRRFVVPRYQRPYSWGEDELQDFWDDLIQVSESGGGLFLGSVILNKEFEESKGHIELVDGQQRLLTLTILSVVLRDISNIYDRKYAELIQRKDIALEDMDGNMTWRILPGESIKTLFINHLLKFPKKPFPENMNAEGRRLEAAYSFFHRVVNTYLEKRDTENGKMVLLKELRKSLSDIFVVAIFLANEESAYEIFEATNAKGVDLSVSDLIKNLVFKNLAPSGEKDDAKESWDEITSNVESTGTELKKFIRYSWISSRTFLPERRLYRVVKKDVKNWRDYLLELHVDSELYKLLLVGDAKEYDDKGYKNSIKLYSSVNAINIMGIQQYVLLLLPLLRNDIPKHIDISNYLNLLENFLFAYFVVSKQPANKIERLFARYAIDLDHTAKIPSEKQKRRSINSTLDNLVSELRRLYPSKDLFIAKFMEIEYKNSPKSRIVIKYILNKFERELSGSDELIPNFNVINIEHLLPQKPAQWNLTKSAVKGYVNLLGNLTLVDKHLNSKAQNSPLADKLEILKKSKLQITRELVELAMSHGRWDEELIRQRQARFAELAYTRIWAM